mmetsp:Transcript_41263/g.74033  ORF Transcript_41263/g.74033 Transcript_41263/m.74033 type:complete len:316 (-) Transcript_41263:85-1032(-)
MSWYSFPLTCRTNSANSLVRLGNPSLLRFNTTMFAMRRATVASSPPHSTRMRSKSDGSTVSRNFHAGTPLDRSKRKSMIPSISGRNPRSPSNCGEEMPISSKTPFGLTPAAANTLAISPNKLLWIVNRGSSFSSSFAAAIASSSISNACNLPCGLSRLKIPRVCPPRPKVPSTYTPCGFGSTKRDNTSSNKAGVWVPMLWVVPVTPPAREMPGVMLKLRPMNLHPFQLRASTHASSVTNLIHPIPLHMPVEGFFISDGSPCISPHSAKKSLSACSVVSYGRYFRQISCLLTTTSLPAANSSHDFPLGPFLLASRS